MIDRRRIVELYQRGNASALVTLVCVEGSSYRRTGARLLIAQDGTYAGSISGGCLEAEVIRKAQWKVRNGAVMERYSTLFDDTADIPYGLGCGGTVHLLLEPAGTPEFEALLQAMQASLHGERFHITTHLPTSTTALRREIVPVSSSTPPSFTLPSLTPGAPRHSPLGTWEASAQPSQEGLYTETLTPPQRLILCGAGDDAQSMARMAALLGWTLIVLDGRAQWATKERFPEAEQVLVSTALQGIRLTPQDAVVLMTHSFEQDRNWLTAVLPAQPRYMGLLGARHRSALLVAEAAARLDWSIDRACASLFAPVGLDLGGDGPEAIALSTLAEIQACIEGKLGRSRRMNATLVAEQLAKGGASQYLQTQCAL